MRITSLFFWEALRRKLLVARRAAVVMLGAWMLDPNQVALAQDSVSVSSQTQTSSVRLPAPLMPLEERLLYLRKLKIFLEADPLDMGEFERQFEVKFVCKPWRNTGQICDYRMDEVRWPYSVFEEPTNKVSYAMYGDGSRDSLWISLLYNGNPGAHNCITGEMVRQVFAPPDWSAEVGVAKSQGTRPNQILLLAIEGRDQLQRRITLVSAGVKGCTGTLQITIHPNKP